MALDVFSMGFLMIEVLTGESISDMLNTGNLRRYYKSLERNGAKTAFDIEKILGPFDLNKDIKNIISQCIQINPRDRPQHAKIVYSCLSEIVTGSTAKSLKSLNSSHSSILVRREKQAQTSGGRTPAKVDSTSTSGKPNPLRATNVVKRLKLRLGEQSDNLVSLKSQPKTSVVSDIDSKDHLL
mmetsp:Transcript_6272/g.7662  ORF Transcript_6272/g.7662 Transcript_6272/m.7662 type:complete len:183 (-) Transcript_6272:49-597(-)|eukprot:jgi/Bigna1/89348/estExt_fgenesh1_pg.C_470122